MIKTKDTYVNKLCIFLFLFFHFDVSSGVGLWLVNTYQYGCDPSVLSHHALGTVEWDESYCIDGGPYLVVGVRGIILPWVILRREGRHDHIWISNFLVTSVPGGGVMPLYGIWAGSTHIWGRRNAAGFLGGTKTDHSLLLTSLHQWGYMSSKLDQDDYY